MIPEEERREFEQNKSYSLGYKQCKEDVIGDIEELRDNYLEKWKDCLDEHPYVYGLQIIDHIIEGFKEEK